MRKKIHALGGKYLKDIVYAANDGIVTTFAVVAGVAGAGLNPIIILVLGFANLIADGFSMATGNYLGTKSESDHYTKERNREEMFLLASPQDAKSEVEEIYRAKGYNEEDPKDLSRLISKNKKFFVDFLVFEKLGFGYTPKREAINGAIATFVSFIIAGAVPLIPYLLIRQGSANGFLWASIFTAAALFTIGAMRTFFSEEKWWLGGFEMLLAGGFAAVIAFFIGAILKSLLNVIV